MAKSSRSRRSSKKGSVVSVNFKGVETRVLVDADTYKVEVDEVTREDGDKAEYFKWKFKVIENEDGDDDFEGSALYLNTSLAENSLWNLKGLLEALGEDVPDDELDVDLEDMVGKECMVVVEHEKYEGKPQAKIIDFSPVEKKKGKKDKDEEEDEDKDDKKKRRSRKDKEDDDDGDDDDKKDKKKKRGKKDKDKVKQSEVTDMSQEELEELIEEHKLDVELGDYKTLRKMVNAVIDALEKDDLLDSDD